VVGRRRRGARRQRRLEQLSETLTETLSGTAATLGATAKGAGETAGTALKEAGETAGAALLAPVESVRERRARLRRRRRRATRTFGFGSVLGAGLGYVLGSREGRERYDAIVAAARKVAEDPKVDRVVAQATSYVNAGRTKAEETVAQAGNAAADKVAQTREQVVDKD
jgi:hypothetical protein